MTKGGTRRVDVAVIGGGPAGLSAAIRCRWVKGHSAIPLETVVFEPGLPGGLGAWRGCYLTGPGFYLKNDELVSNLLTDIERFEIPIIKERVTRVIPADDGLWQVESDNGPLAVCRSVIIATGLRAQVNEGRMFANGVYLTYMGYEFLQRIFSQIPRTRSANAPIVVVGNAKSELIAPILKQLEDDEGADIRLLVEPGNVPADPWLAERSIEGILQSVDNDGDRVRINLANEALAASAMIVDYNAFELKPDDSLHANVDRDERGFVVTDSVTATSKPGIFAAGDITGGYAMVLNALNQGAQAGFAAYEYIYQRRFGTDPVMFAYKPADVRIEKGFRTLPAWRTSDLIVTLVSAERLPEFRIGTSSPGQELLVLGSFAFSDLQELVGASDATAVLDNWLEQKIVTVRRNGQ